MKTVDSRKFFRERGLIAGDLVYITRSSTNVNIKSGWYLLLPGLSFISISPNSKAAMSTDAYNEGMVNKTIKVKSIITTVDYSEDLGFCVALNKFIEHCYGSQAYSLGTDFIRGYITELAYPSRMIKVAQGVFFGKDVQYTWIVPGSLEVKKGDIVKANTKFGEQIVKIKKVEVLSEENFENRLGSIDVQEIIEVLDI